MSTAFIDVNLAILSDESVSETDLVCWRYVREEFKKFGEQQNLFPSPRGVHDGIMRARVGRGRSC